MQTVVILGPEGTISHEAALRFHPDRSIKTEKNFPAVLNAVAFGGHDMALVPVITGAGDMIKPVFSGLAAHKRRLWLTDLEAFPVIHNLFSFANSLDEVRSVVTVSEAVLPQVAVWMNSHMADCLAIRSESTVKGIQLVASERDPSMAAIGGDLAASLYPDVPVLARGIQNPGNQTLFGRVVNKRPNIERGGVMLFMGHRSHLEQFTDTLKENGLAATAVLGISKDSPEIVCEVEDNLAPETASNFDSEEIEEQCNETFFLAGAYKSVSINAFDSEQIKIRGTWKQC